MPGVKVGRNRKLAVAIAFNGDVLAFGSVNVFPMYRFVDSIHQAELAFGEAVFKGIGGDVDYSVVIEGTGQWKTLAPQISFADLEGVYIVNA